MSERFTVWQCRDWCCDTKPFSEKWWNVGMALGNYDSVPSWHGALAIIRSRQLRSKR